MQVLWAAALPESYYAISAINGLIPCYPYITDTLSEIIFDPQTGAEYYAVCSDIPHADVYDFEYANIRYKLTIDGVDIKLIPYHIPNVHSQVKMLPGYIKLYGYLRLLHVSDDQSVVIASSGRWVVAIAIDWTQVNWSRKLHR